MKNLDLKTAPQILHSKYLSGETGLDVSFLDYSCMPTGTHKWYKAERIVENAKNRGYGAILFINPVIDDREEADGSGIDSLRLVCALNHPDAQVISVVHDNRVLWKESVHPDFPDSRQRVNLGLDLNKFCSVERLEKYFKDLMQRSDGDDETKKTRDFLYSTISPSKCIDGTNLGDVGEYGLSKDMIGRLNKFDYLVGSAGAGGRALNQINSLKSGKPKHIIVVPNGHPLDPFHRYEKSTSPRVQVKFRGKIHNVLKENSVDRDDVAYKAIGIFGGKQAKEVFVDKAIKNDNLDMETSADGAIGCSILRNGNFTGDGLKIFNSHRSTANGFNYLYEQLIPKGSKVCFVNTGSSNNLKLKSLIEQGIVE